MKDGDNRRGTDSVSRAGHPESDTARHSISERNPAGNFPAEQDLLPLLRLQNLGALATAFSHKINNLLNSVVGYSSLVLAESEFPAELANNLETVEESAREAAELNYQFLSLANRKLGEERNGSVHLEPLLRDVIHLLGRVPSRRFRLTDDIAPDLPPVAGNAEGIRQVVLALLQAAKGDSHVRCHVRLTAEGYGEEGNPAGGVRIAVARKPEPGDSLEEGWNPEWAGAAAPHPSLPLADAIVRALGGSTSFSSGDDGTLHLEVRLPAAAREEAADPAGPGPENPASGNAGTILIVDDEKTVRDMTSAYLTRTGFRTLTAKDGREALDIYQAKKSEIDVTLLDLTMPGMDGFEAMRAIRRIDPNARIILSSGHPDDARTHSSLCSAYLNKPYTLSNLTSVVRNALDEEGMPIVG